MAWVAVDKAGKEGIFANKSYRKSSNRSLIGLYEPEFWSDEDVSDYGNEDTEIKLPKGTIKKLIGRDLTWEDNPVELKED